MSQQAPRRLACILWTLLLMPAGLAAQDAGWRYRRLDLDVTVDLASHRLKIDGRAVVEVTSEFVTDLSFGLNTRTPAMHFLQISAPVLREQFTIAVDSPVQRAHAKLRRPLRRGDTLAVQFELVSGRASSQLLVTDTVALASWVEGWYPVLLGEGGGMSAWSAPGVTRFQLPAGWRAVSNGRLASSELRADSTVVEVWETSAAVNRSFAAASYKVARTRVGTLEIAAYLLRADSASIHKQANALAQAIAAMERVWGHYPYSGYTIAEIPDGAVTWSASAEQGFIMATTSQFGEDGNLPLFAHEAAHAWWGNHVQTTGPGRQLVSESLAQYGAVIAIEAIEGGDAMRDFLRFSRRGYNALQSAAGYFAIVRMGGDKPLAELSNGRWDHNLSDAKGHWFYHMLRNRVGDEAFFRVLRQLQHTYAGRALSLADLRREFIGALPDQGLAGFMEQWLDRAGAPLLEHRWWSVEGGSAVHLELTQTQALPYDIEVVVELLLRNGQRRRHAVNLRQRQQVYSLPVNARAVELKLDPDHVLLHWRPEYGPPPKP